MRHHTHGHTGDPIYNSWSNMLQRCTNPKHPSYPRYGGRGITVCADWRDGAEFIRWAYANGFRVGLSIERVDNDGNYCPENCRWASRKEQQRNRQANHWVTYNGETKCLTEWAEILGMNPATLYHRLEHAGLTVEEAFNTEVRPIRSGQIIGTNKDGESTLFPSAAESARSLGVDARNIRICLSGRTKHAYGYSWKYAEDVM